MDEMMTLNGGDSEFGSTCPTKAGFQKKLKSYENDKAKQERYIKWFYENCAA